MSSRTPDVAMSVSLDSDLETVSATLTLDGLGSPFTATGEAWRSFRDPDPHIEYELALSRALSRLEHRIMERVHERIDRSATDDI